MKVIARIVLVVLLGSMFLSLFYLSTGMNMAAGMSDCPFMAHEEVVCPMDLADHLAAWKSAFVSVSPTVVLLLGVAVVCLASLAPNIKATMSYQLPLGVSIVRERVYTYVYRLFQELFARGILHPKIF